MSSPLELFLTGTLDTHTLLYLGVSSVFVYWCYIVLSRLVFHPLAGLPGPKLVALTDWYGELDSSPFSSYRLHAVLVDIR